MGETQDKRPKLYEEIVRQLMQRIHDGALRPGDRLPAERVLAEEMGVSRTAIREALRSMELMGCLESHVGEGTYIKAPSLQNIVDPFSMVFRQDQNLQAELLEVRLLLETEVATLAARRRTAGQLLALRLTVTEMQTAVEEGGTGAREDDEFHRLLTEAAGNGALQVILSMCDGMISQTRELTQRMSGVPAATLRDHRAILDAVEAGDEKRARRTMRQHLLRAQRNLQRLK